MSKRMRETVRRAVCAVLALLVLLPQTAGASGHITAAGGSYTVKQGEMLQVPLEEVFSDGEGHTLTYTVAESGGNLAATPIKDGVFYFTARDAGEYAPVVAASCGQERQTAVLRITVESAGEGDQRQYGYNETPAESVTVYATLSSDGVPLVGDDGTWLMGLKVTVPYFDLGLYGLDDLYRYATDGGSGSYAGTTVIERPTLLHLYIWLLERYYIGLPEEECGKGDSGLLEYSEMGREVLNIYGSAAYESYTDAVQFTGSSTSLYMKSFWGHDENLMYYRNHMYPLMSPGWGATSDYILLSDGDVIDLAMFSNWNFYTYGAFCCFDRDSYTVAAGETLTVQTQKYDTKSVTDGGTEQFEPIDKLTLSIYNTKSECVETVGGGDTFTVTLTEPGVYYLLAVDPGAESSEACYAPAVARVTVTGTSDCDLNGDGILDITDLQALFAHLDGTKPLAGAALGMADVNGDGDVNILDYQYLYLRITRAG